MNTETIVTMNIPDDKESQMSMTIAVVAAQQLQDYHERALGVLHLTGYITRFSVSRFNRGLHALKGASELLTQGQLFIIDALPVLVRKWSRFDHCRKLGGKEVIGYCASKDEYFFSWHLHLICDRQGIPVSFNLLPARWDELNPLQHWLASSQVVADKDEQLADIHGLVRHNMAGNTPDDLRFSVNLRRWAFSDFMLAVTFSNSLKSQSELRWLAILFGKYYWSRHQIAEWLPATIRHQEPKDANCSID